MHAALKRLLIVAVLILTVSSPAMAQQIRWAGIGPIYPGTFFPNAICLDAANQDTCLQRDAANVLAQVNGVNAQSLRIYNTFTSTTNFERLEILWSGNLATIQTNQGGGGGLSRELQLGTVGTGIINLFTNNTDRWHVDATGNLFPSGSNLYTLGQAANRPTQVFAGSSGLDTTGQINSALGTITSQVPILTGTVTWNNGAITFSADILSITDTASAAGSLLWDRQVGAVSKGKLDKTGAMTLASGLTATSGTFSGLTANTAIVSGAGGLVQSVAAVTNGVLINGAPPTFSATPTVTSLTTGMGTGAGTATNIGVANIQTSAAGVGNGADTTDDTLFTYSLPLNSMSANGKSVRLRAWGTLAANANSKQVKLWFAGTSIVTPAANTSNGNKWYIEAEVTRIDATHVSTIGSFNDAVGADQATNVNANLVVSDLTANASIIKVTGASTVTGAASDVVGYGMKIWFEN